MSSSILSFVGWLDSLGAAFHTNDAEKRKTTILIRACFLTGIFMILYLGNCFFIEFGIGLYILPFESFIFFLIPFLIKRGLKPKVAAHLFILNGTAFGILLVWFSGGLQSPVTPWLTLMPICAILFMDARNAWIWAFIILSIIFAMGGYWLWVDAAPKNYNESRSPLFFLNCYAGLIFIYLLLSLIFEKRLNATIYELEASESSLQHSNQQLKESLETLKVTQNQLIHAEKMASLGELTAGIAHEIQNPLNFVNNFSEVSTELIQEVKSERSKLKSERDEVLEEALLNDIAQNLEKINHHGRRADAIVKGMLAHSRTSSGKKELTDLNALAEEYLRLSYHGLKAKDASFAARLEFKPDTNLPKVNIVPQDIGRVLLNLMNNAFYACAEQSSSTAQGESNNGETGYSPIVEVSTMHAGNQVTISVSDNGGGIPDAIKEKIFQPFFTTKPTREGTGLGLSLSYDIVKAHGGEISVETKVGAGSTFYIQLPIV